MTNDYTNDLVFLDFEASSLAPDSWPVEIGLSWLTDTGEIESHAQLIRRHPNWSMEAWSPQSEGLHGISYQVLETEGVEAANAAEWFLSNTRGRRIGSDAPEFEMKWLRRLLETSFDASAVDREIARVQDFYALIEPMLSEQSLDTFFERLARLPAPHRAGPDSSRYAKALKAAFDRR